MLERIFLTVLSTSLVTSIIIILLMILSPFINRRYAAKWKYWVWILLALRLMIPFNMSDMQNMLENLSRSLTDVVMPYESNTYKSDTAGPTIQTSQKILLEIPSRMTEPLSPPKKIGATSNVTFLMIVEFIWLTGGILFSAVHLCSYLLYRRKINQNGHRIVNDSICVLYDKLFDELQLDRRIPIVVCDRADSPMVLGFIHPVLVLPAEEYSDEELYFIFKHELIHYKRHDVCFKLLFVLANAVHWFNPVVWLMQREAVVDMELSCDENVMLNADYTARKTYTEILFSILHKKCTNKTPLSTQFYGGKQVMKKRFRNILERSGKRSGLYIPFCTLGLVMGLGFLIGCSVSEPDRLEKTSAEEGALEGIVANSVDVPDIVLNHTKELVSEWYAVAQADFPDYGYANWRIELLTHCHTYDDFEGMTVQIYQLNYELLSEKPQNIMLTGGMSITEDGWVTPDYSNSRFLVFQQNGDDLSYLTYLFENDCYPPDEIFTDDLRNQLEATDIIAASENSDTTTPAYIVGGASQEASAETVQTENEQMEEAEIKGAVQAEEMTFSCEVSGCTETEAHQHGLCGIDGCIQIGEHSHGICDIAGCTETETHLHNGEYCYPHSADDGHAYHNCGVSGCTEKTAHTHGACGIDGCTQIGEHHHGGNSGGHHQSGHH
ncbi:MAG: M56 family metallopeptidase [Lachnospiraceae bacterium]|nr:M56 family metallopeptidase [Lachnospiraceae bacterium]